MKNGVEDLKIYKLSHELALKIHKMTFSLPKSEIFEEGSQIRRSSKSVSTQIVEGYSLRKYKNEFLHYLHRAYSESMETVEHLKYLFETGSLSDKELFNKFIEEYTELNKMLFCFIESVEQQHQKPEYVKEDGVLNYTN